MKRIANGTRAFFLLRGLVVGAAVLLLAGFGVYFYCLNHFELVPARFVCPLSADAASLSGMKIVLFSDLHMLDSQRDLSHLRACIRLINAERPDLILFGGDLVATDNVEWRLPPARIVARLRSLTAKYGVYAVLGNHDWYAGDALALERMLRQVGFTVLDNTSVTIPGRCNLVGVEDGEGPAGPQPQVALKGVDPALPVIALSHRPEYAALFPPSVKLIFSGHTHGGQVNLPFIRTLLMRHNGCEEFPGRHYVFPGGRNLFISHGIGTSWVRVRVNCPSDIVVVTCRGPESQITNHVSRTTESGHEG